MLALTRRHFYLGAQILWLWTASCGSGRVEPKGRFEPASRDELGAAASRTQRPGYRLLRVRWRSDDGQVSVSGNGAVRMAPDSLRVDLAIRLGVGRATLILAGDSVAADPPQLVGTILPDRYALWAALGVLELPAEPVTASRLTDGPRTFWKLADAGGREWTYEMHGDTLAGVTRTEGGQAIARLELARGADGEVSKATATDLKRGARFELTIVSRESSDAFPNAVWHLRQ